MKSTEWKTYRTRFLVKAKQLNSKLSFTDHLGREHCGGKGDYLVESFDGVLTITPRKIFEDVYVPMLLEANAADSPARSNCGSSMSAAQAVCNGEPQAGIEFDSNNGAQLAPWRIEPFAIASLQIEQVRPSRFRETSPSLSYTDPDTSRIRRKSPQPVRSASRRIGLM
jgi:hypothetical protein